MSTPHIAVELATLADRIARIRPVGRNGDAGVFYEDRSQCVSDARALARWEQTGEMPALYIPFADRQREDERRPSYRHR